ncbi:hypothetical protein Mp_1g16970 [Marchantia polymorpha subsp. ruderalis]|uniref:CTLH domain-containing protein n=2 Tax=Marchantia polymorpha TaxID=3197 RepID=A0AAF6AR20_MARPO|nr:hypothetical protein MARPO_0001s0037 [Marchantia polymorpha]BBM98890.1 hypothetical protein Mp_1g16970 [Marchantia polymorpha subsp. ruderalis]|eukprot:PTQ49966.1 hypothetical protein MARPO_0001s0037 [Marchantia polymorpha]
MDVDPRDYEHVKINDNDVRKIVLSYLVHNCFKETAETFISCTGMKRSVDCSVDIDKRKPIYKHVMEGNVLKAIELTNQLAADLLQSNKDVYFDLLTLHFVELVRSKDCTGALEFAQKELRPFTSGKHLERLQDCMALLAYEDPETSPLFSLLSMDHRQSIADALNRAVLVHANLPSYTSMERLIQHITVVRQRLHQELGKVWLFKQVSDMFYLPLLDGSLQVKLEEVSQHSSNLGFRTLQYQLKQSVL